MAALKLRPGATFDTQAFFDWCVTQINEASMARKWLPDFIRIVGDFEYTETQKILVRNLKKTHFDKDRLPNEPLYWHERGDTSFRSFTREDYKRLRDQFAAAERLHLLDR